MMSEGEALRHAIRQKCLYCCGSSIKVAAGCTSEDCPLWPYRPQFAPRKPKNKGTVQISMHMVLEMQGGERCERLNKRQGYSG